MLRLLYEDSKTTPEFCNKAIDAAMLKTPISETTKTDFNK